MAPSPSIASADALELQHAQEFLLVFERCVLTAWSTSRLTDEIMAEWTHLRRVEIEHRKAARALLAAP